MLMVTLTLEAARSRLGLTSANFQKAVDSGDLQVEHSGDGDRVTEAAMARFRSRQRERKLRGMERITALSNDVGFTE
ncbi:hypothetical protein [Curtobacterium sp. MCBD17_040]|uniref:hypothetical protein n=1 Tax=Curtobacterium sp. MCBD17_040 TaxID=2175674 RepID=UPI000DA734CB|nr:hypothetical protein [Curtobacterium sp. MCBD17_040]WIB65504.1 hypothetical protein DEI94_19210 [Curtobacterium sp. MCBD17_040]